jgi:hypothetical protein
MRAFDPVRLAAVYAHVYGVAADEVCAAAGRAAAMRTSDQWVADGCDPESPAVAARALLCPHRRPGARAGTTLPVPPRSAGAASGPDAPAARTVDR